MEAYPANPYWLDKEHECLEEDQCPERYGAPKNFEAGTWSLPIPTGNVLRGTAEDIEPLENGPDTYSPMTSPRYGAGYRGLDLAIALCDINPGWSMKMKRYTMEDSFTVSGDVDLITRRIVDRLSSAGLKPVQVQNSIEVRTGSDLLLRLLASSWHPTAFLLGLLCTWPQMRKEPGSRLPPMTGSDGT